MVEFKSIIHEIHDGVIIPVWNSKLKWHRSLIFISGFSCLDMIWYLKRINLRMDMESAGKKYSCLYVCLVRWLMFFIWASRRKECLVYFDNYVLRTIVAFIAVVFDSSWI